MASEVKEFVENLANQIANIYQDPRTEAREANVYHWKELIETAIDMAVTESQPPVAADVEALALESANITLDFCLPDDADLAYDDDIATAQHAISHTITTFLTAHDAAKDAEIERLREALEEITDKAESADPVWAIAYCALHEKEIDEYMAEKGGPDATD